MKSPSIPLYERGRIDEGIYKRGENRGKNLEKGENKGGFCN